MLYEMLSYVVEIVAGLLAGFLLLRFWMQALRVRPPQSLALSIFQLTDWIVRPIRRIVPGFAGLDWASLIAAFFVAMIPALLEVMMNGFFNTLLVLVLTSFRLLHWILYGLMGLLIMEAVLSFVNPHAPLAPLIRALNAPLLAPLRRIIPPIGGLDFSVLVAFLLLQLIGQLLVRELPRVIMFIARM